MRTAVILSLSLAAGGGTAALYLTTPAPVATAVVTAVAACGAAIRVLSRVIR